MNKIVISIAMAVLVSVLSPVVASAHVLETDGSIGAVLHIKPDDNPQAGTPTGYVLYFQDSNGRFSLGTCDCAVAVVENGKVIHKAPLVVSSSTASENTVTFPAPDVYSLQVTGRPKTSGVFQPFVLSYIVRVAGGQQNYGGFPLLLGVGLAMMVGLVLLFAYASDNDRKANSHPKEKR